MNIVVCVKQTFDTEAKICLTDNGRIDDSKALLVVNPYDEFAVETAIRIKEREGGEITAVTIGTDKARSALQQCLAMGVDHAVLVNDPALKDADSHSVALVLGRAINSLDYDLILCGRESVDMAASQVPSRLAEILDLPQINVVSDFQIADGVVDARRDVDGGTESLEVKLPVVLSVQKGINEVRYPSLRLVMKASRLPIKSISLSDLDLTPQEIIPQVRVVEYVFPEPREKGRLISGETAEVVTELIQYLKDEIKAI